MLVEVLLELYSRAVVFKCGVISGAAPAMHTRSAYTRMLIEKHRMERGRRRKHATYYIVDMCTYKHS